MLRRFVRRGAAALCVGVREVSGAAEKQKGDLPMG